MEVSEEEIRQVPTERYLTGVIYPEIIDEEAKEIDEENEKEDEDEESHSNLNLPRSMGFSCVIDSSIDVNKIGISISGSKYVEESKRWTHSPISSEESRLLSIDGTSLSIKFTNKKESNEITVFQKKYGKHFGHTGTIFPLKGTVHNALPWTNMYAKTNIVTWLYISY